MANPYKNDTGVSLSMAVYLATDDYDHNMDAKTISVTSLMKPIKQIILGMRIPVNDESTEVASLVASRIGTSIHTGIENAWLNNYAKALLDLGYPQKVIDKIVINPDSSVDLTGKIPIYMERRTDKQIAGWTVSGKFDFVAEGRLEDFKSTKVYSYVKGVNNKKYALQGSIYKWLNPDIITNDHMAIQFIFTDFAAAQAKINKAYPATAVLEMKVPLLANLATEQYIKDKLNQIDTLMQKPEEEIPPCTDEDLWQSDSVWKYYKNPDKLTRSTKNFDSSYEANVAQSEAGVGIVIEVKGEVRACKYCAALNLCQQKDAYILNGSLKV